MSSTPPSEVAVLDHDIRLIHEACQRSMDEHPITIANADDRRYYIIVGDLWRKHVDHCEGVAVLLARGLIDSATVVNRAVYESAIMLLYLMTVG